MSDVRLTVTYQAVQKIQQLMASKTPVPFGIKIFVYGDGNNVNYAMNFTDHVQTYDQVCTIEDINFVMDQSSALFLDNVTLDFVDMNEVQGFTFKPNCIGKSCTTCDGSCGRYG